MILVSKLFDFSFPFHSYDFFVQDDDHVLTIVHDANEVLSWIDLRRGCVVCLSMSSLATLSEGRIATRQAVQLDFSLRNFWTPFFFFSLILIFGTRNKKNGRNCVFALA